MNDTPRLHRHARNGNKKKAFVLGAATIALLAATLLALRSTREAPGPRALAAAAAANHHVPDACDLLPAGAVESVLGEPLAPPRRSEGGCEYQRPPDGGASGMRAVVTARYYRIITREAFEVEVRRSAALLEEAFVPVSGIGEEAFQMGSIAVAAYARGGAVVVTRGDVSVDVPEMTEIARRAIARIPP